MSAEPRSTNTHLPVMRALLSSLSPEVSPLVTIPNSLPPYNVPQSKNIPEKGDTEGRHEPKIEFQFDPSLTGTNSRSQRRKYALYKARSDIDQR